MFAYSVILRIFAETIKKVMTTLEFTKNGSRWESEVLSPDKEFTLQVNRAGRGEFTVYARISDEGGG